MNEPVLKISTDNGKTIGPVLKLATNGTMTIDGGNRASEHYHQIHIDHLKKLYNISVIDNLRMHVFGDVNRYAHIFSYTILYEMSLNTLKDKIERYE